MVGVFLTEDLFLFNFPELVPQTMWTCTSTVCRGLFTAWRRKAQLERKSLQGFLCHGGFLTEGEHPPSWKEKDGKDFRVMTWPCSFSDRKLFYCFCFPKLVTTKVIFFQDSKKKGPEMELNL